MGKFDYISFSGFAVINQQENKNKSVVYGRDRLQPNQHGEIRLHFFLGALWENLEVSVLA
jgi:hypothetical protein